MNSEQYKYLLGETPIQCLVKIKFDQQGDITVKYEWKTIQTNLNYRQKHLLTDFISFTEFHPEFFVDSWFHLYKQKCIYLFYFFINWFIKKYQSVLYNIPLYHTKICYIYFFLQSFAHSKVNLNLISFLFYAAGQGMFSPPPLAPRSPDWSFRYIKFPGMTLHTQHLC